MANLEPKELARLRQCLDNCTDSLLLAAIHDPHAPTDSLKGVLGVIDWRVHGHVSQILSREDELDFHLVPSKNQLGKASLLVLRQDSAKALAKLPQLLQKLDVNKICLAETTFAEKDLPKLHDSLRKAQVSWNRLESLA